MNSAEFAKKFMNETIDVFHNSRDAFDPPKPVVARFEKAGTEYIVKDIYYDYQEKRWVIDLG